MGAICGIVSRSSDDIPLNLSEPMMGKLMIYPMDNWGIYRKGKIFLGNIINYITPESMMEKLPYEHTETSLVITADAIIDNRREVFRLLDIPEKDWGKIPDSKLILMTYLRWGEECPKHLVGDFSFVIWNSKSGELFCARDHVGRKTFFYRSSQKLFSFCTIMKPLLNLEGKDELNEQWVADYLALNTLAHEVDCSTTVYRNINQLPPGHTLKLNTNGLTIERYWNPLDVSELKLKNDAEYEEAFREVFFEAVRCRLRSIGEVGIMLSGGLDSGSVASVAAMMLNENGRKLKAFTAVPIPDYKNWLSRRLVADEREYIYEIVNKHKNIDIMHCSFDDINSYNSIDKLIGIIEQPYKIVQNFFWVNEIASKSAQSNCSVLLDGQLGNCTISYGDIDSYLVTLYGKRKYISILKEIYYYSKIHNYKYNDVLRCFLSQVCPTKVKGIYHKLKGTQIISEKNDSTKLINEKFAKELNIDKRFRELKKGEYKSVKQDIYEARKFIYDNILFSHAGAIATKISLEHGIERRDPSSDKRVIEFCMSLPESQFVSKGVERSLIRRAMVGILPDKIRLNHSTRGRQGADFVQRLQVNLMDIRKELRFIIENENINRYIRRATIEETLNSLDSLQNYKKHQNMQMLLIAIVFTRFINSCD